MDHHFRLSYIKSSQDVDYLLYSRKKVVPPSFVYGRKTRKDKVDRKLYVPATEGFDVYLSDRQRVWYCEILYTKHNVHRKRAGGRDETWPEDTFIEAVNASLHTSTTAISYNIKETDEGLSFEIKEKLGEVYRSNTAGCVCVECDQEKSAELLAEIQYTEIFNVAAAVRTGKVDNLKNLIARGADIHAVNKGGWSHLQVAADAGQLTMVLYLIEQQLDINYTSPDTYTALMCAIRRGRVDVVKVLVDAGAKWYYEDSYLHTPLGLAVATKQVQILRYFCAKDGIATKKVLERYGERNRQPLRTLFQLIYEDKPEYVFPDEEMQTE